EHAAQVGVGVDFVLDATVLAVGKLLPLLRQHVAIDIDDGDDAHTLDATEAIEVVAAAAAQANAGDPDFVVGLPTWDRERCKTERERGRAGALEKMATRQNGHEAPEMGG